ncbi:hypothetical protein BJ508DRAFT_379530 [Ascobolus immersus RN42]|uniref:Uncharacterized protein n=1 Tax=Ascobolus immersus RN42 TaxID=1160509 RepID=A0A3N4HR23_ASCIM|nr:hypothetical protein BJ508DRAFT_379530 [Ascobolus immersus RN42]
MTNLSRIRQLLSRSSPLTSSGTSIRLTGPLIRSPNPATVSPTRLLTTSTFRRPTPTTVSLLLRQPNTLILPHQLSARHITTKTKLYLKSQTRTFFETVFYGYTILFLLGWTLFGCLNLYLEQKHATPECFDFWTRLYLRQGWAYLKMWGDNDRGREFIALAVERLDSILAEKEGKKVSDKEETLADKAWKVLDIALGEGTVGTKAWWREYRKVQFEMAEAERKMGHKILERKCYEKIIGGSWSDSEDKARAAMKIAELDFEAGEDEACGRNLERAFELAGGDLGKKGVLDAIPATAVTKVLLEADTELQVHNVRMGNTKTALPAFLSILRARQSNPKELGDPCEEGKLMSYVAEILWAGRNKKDGLAWNRKALETVVPLAELRQSCNECARYALGNMEIMMEYNKDKKGMQEVHETKEWLDSLRVIRGE